jgi:hypothetical protein
MIAPLSVGKAGRGSCTSGATLADGLLRVNFHWAGRCEGVADGAVDWQGHDVRFGCKAQRKLTADFDYPVSAPCLTSLLVRS